MIEEFAKMASDAYVTSLIWIGAIAAGALIFIIAMRMDEHDD